MPVKRVLLGAYLAGALFGTGAWLWPQSAQNSPRAAGPKTAEQVYKNIQVLRDVPADQIMPAMQFITASLGVQCDFCHLENAFEKDDKEAKQTARKMIRMVFAINNASFEGHQGVTCFACHRGARKPLTTPTISEDEGKIGAGAKMHSTEPDTTGLPGTDQILGKYLQAVGGADAAARILTRIQKGTLTVGSKQFPVEVLAEAPAKRVTTVRFPGGDSITGVNGDEGWLSAPGRPVHEMGSSEADGARVDAELFFPSTLKQLFKELRVQRRDQLNGRGAYLVLGVRDKWPPVHLYFDEESGLLVRMVRYAETPLGPNPAQTDYADYRQDGGLRIPFRWTVARPSGRFTIQIEQLQQNVPIEDEKFAKPASPAPSP
jgi:photosynthetic reaction center cytochrome c subunit